jgi:hypothetical protein
MSTVSGLLDEIKTKCPEQSSDIDKLISNIDDTVLSKSINKSKSIKSKSSSNKSIKSKSIKSKSSSSNRLNKTVNKQKTVKKSDKTFKEPKVQKPVKEPKVQKPVKKPDKTVKKPDKTIKKSDNKIKDIKSFLKDKSNKDIVIEYNQTNTKQKSSKSYQRYENYKSATTIGDAKKLGATLGDMENDYKKGLLKIINDKSSSKSSSKPSDKAMPFSSIEGCGVINFNEESVKLIREDSFEEKSKHFDEILTHDDGNCGYHSIIQGLIESYYVLGNKSNDNLKQFISNIKNILNLDPKQIVSDNRKNKKITIPREVINHFRQFILDVKAHPKLRVPMPDGTLKHVFEREDEVVEYPYDGGKGKYLKKKKSAKDVKKEKINNKEIINRIQGGIKDSGIITSNYWLREEVLSGIFFIFNIPIYTFLKYIDTDTGMDRSNNLLPKNCSSVKDCGHIIFMVKNEIHFNYITTNIQGYNSNILKCLELDELSSSSKSSSSKSSSSKSSSSNEDVNKLMTILNKNKSEAKELLDKADGDVHLAMNMVLKSKSSSSSSSLSNKPFTFNQLSNSKSNSKSKSTSKSKSNSKSKSTSNSKSKSTSSLESNMPSGSDDSNVLKPLKSVASSVDSVMSESELENIDYTKYPKLYEQELYKILRKKMPKANEPQIKKIFTEEINKIKSKYKK